MVSNRFGAEVATQCRRPLPTFARLNVFHYLSLISWRFGGLFRIAGPAAAVVAAVARAEEGGRGKVKRRLPSRDPCRRCLG